MIQHSEVKQTSATKLVRVELKSQNDASCVFNNLGHIIDVELLRECFRDLDGSKAVGIDGVTKAAYGANLESNITDLILRVRKGTYIPQASRLVGIPKIDGTKRTLAIACVEDKLVQDACKRILERIYEPIFLPVSFGFRPGSNPHKALVALDGHLKLPQTGALIDVDLRKAFDMIPHEFLEKFLRVKISDERFLHLILKLIKAETIDAENVRRRNTCGVPQGSALSPLLCNIFLHHVVDVWFMELNKREYSGQCRLTRYCDDMVFTVSSEEGAWRLHKLLGEQLELFGMQLHEGKTRVIPNGSRAAKAHDSEGKRVPSFSFLGFIHVWGRAQNRSTGKIFLRVKRRTCPKRYRAKLSEMKEYIQTNRHKKDLLKVTARVVQGYLNYFAINDNSRRINMFVKEVRCLLFKWLNRRSQKKNLTWEKFNSTLNRINFPQPKILHDLFFNSSAFKPQCR